MAGGAKAEFPPLLPAGFHDMDLHRLRALCVDAFPLSRRREPLMELVGEICSELTSVSLYTEVWVDGSFLTAKIEPDDVHEGYSSCKDTAAMSIFDTLEKLQDTHATMTRLERELAHDPDDYALNLALRSLEARERKLAQKFRDLAHADWLLACSAVCKNAFKPS